MMDTEHLSTLASKYQSTGGLTATKTVVFHYLVWFVGVEFSAGVHIRKLTVDDNAILKMAVLLLKDSATTDVTTGDAIRKFRVTRTPGVCLLSCLPQHPCINIKRSQSASGPRGQNSYKCVYL